MNAPLLRKLSLTIAFFIGLTVASTLHAQTGTCNDGTKTNATTKRGACSGHGGVKTWNGSSSATTTTAPPPVAQPERTTTGGGARIPPAQPTPAPKANVSTTAATPAPGGGAGQVWVNMPTKIYHCPGTQWYGKTKNGKYMSESDAKAMGARADHNKSCSTQ